MGWEAEERPVVNGEREGEGVLLERSPRGAWAVAGVAGLGEEGVVPHGA